MFKKILIGFIPVVLLVIFIFNKNIFDNQKIANIPVDPAYKEIMSAYLNTIREGKMEEAYYKYTHPSYKKNKPLEIYMDIYKNRLIEFGKLVSFEEIIDETTSQNPKVLFCKYSLKFERRTKTVIFSLNKINDQEKNFFISNSFENSTNSLKEVLY